MLGASIAHPSLWEEHWSENVPRSAHPGWCFPWRGDSRQQLKCAYTLNTAPVPVLSELSCKGDMFASSRQGELKPMHHPLLWLLGSCTTLQWRCILLLLDAVAATQHNQWREGELLG